MVELYFYAMPLWLGVSLVMKTDNFNVYLFTNMHLEILRQKLALAIDLGEIRIW
jgi:hypothetical protein